MGATWLQLVLRAGWVTLVSSPLPAQTTLPMPPSAWSQNQSGAHSQSPCASLPSLFLLKMSQMRREVLLNFTGHEGVGSPESLMWISGNHSPELSSSSRYPPASSLGLHEFSAKLTNQQAGKGTSWHRAPTVCLHLSYSPGSANVHGPLSFAYIPIS